MPTSQTVEVSHTAVALHHQAGAAFWQNEALLLRDRVVQLETTMNSVEALEARLAELRPPDGPPPDAP